MIPDRSVPSGAEAGGLCASTAQQRREHGRFPAATEVTESAMTSMGLSPVAVHPLTAGEPFARAYGQDARITRRGVPRDRLVGAGTCTRWGRAPPARAPSGPTSASAHHGS